MRASRSSFLAAFWSASSPSLVSLPAWPGKKLPDVRDQGRNDDEGGRLRRRRHESEQGHRNRREPHAGYALDEAREQEDERDDESLGGDPLHSQDMIVAWPG